MKHPSKFNAAGTLFILLICSAFAFSSHQIAKNLFSGNGSFIDTHLLPIVSKSTHSSANDCRLSGQIINILDGDSAILQDNKNTQHNIRLAGIDAPEYNQAYGEVSKEYLTDLVLMKTVCVDWKYIDEYQRKIGILYLNDNDINLEMLSKGLAWHYKQFENTQSEENRQRYSNHERNARIAQIGIWSQSNPITPWDWRENNNKETKSDSSNIKTLLEPAIKRIKNERIKTCGDKRYCKHMNSCDQACFYLQECDLNRLDRDQDGIPCESLCEFKCS